MVTVTGYDGDAPSRPVREAVMEPSMTTRPSPGDVAASGRYWHHAYDEWYVARRLNPKLMGRLWNEFYIPSIRSGLQHPGLGRALTHILEEQPEMARHWTGFMRDIGVEH